MPPAADGTGGELRPVDGGFVYHFSAMASPCEVRIESADAAMAERIGVAAEAEARRIEKKFSRYEDDNIVAAINRSHGQPIIVDDETAGLLDYAAHCHRMSRGLFDVTSGVLRRIWKFDGSDQVPAADAVAALRPLVGWRKLRWRRPILILPAGMEVDFGGIGKEYAVDRAIHAVNRLADLAVLVNFGGDLRVTRARDNGAPWHVAIDSLDGEDGVEAVMELRQGALTTSGDSRRFLLKNGIRYSHILDPRTGWPVADPPRSVTVAAPTCLEAGLLSTLAMLHGAKAEAFLRREGIKAWWIR